MQSYDYKPGVLHGLYKTHFEKICRLKSYFSKTVVFYLVYTETYNLFWQSFYDIETSNLYTLVRSIKHISKCLLGMLSK